MSARFGRYFKLGLGASGLLLSTAPVAFAEEKKRKSIYDDDEAKPVESPKQEAPAEEDGQSGRKVVDGVQVRSFEGLEKNLSVARKWLIKEIDSTKETVDTTVQKYLKVEKDVTSTVAGLRSEKENILPGGIYVLISALSGSILARNRNILVRAATPVVLGIGAFGYFLPNTFQNTRNLVWKYEQRAPTLANYHIQAQNHVESMVKGVEDVMEDGKQGLESGVHKTRKFIADSTGLKLTNDDDENQKKK